MIKVTIELNPSQEANPDKVLRILEIINDEKGDSTLANYDVRLFDGNRRVINFAKLERYVRRNDVVFLVEEAIKALEDDKNLKKLVLFDKQAR